MPSKNTTSLGLNQWDASDKPVREDFVRDNTIINDKITQLNSDLASKLTYLENGLYNYNVSISDCNSAVAPGKYLCAQSANAPTPYGLLTVEYSGNYGEWIIQTYKSVSESDIPTMFIRSKINYKSWTIWRQIN